MSPSAIKSVDKLPPQKTGVNVRYSIEWTWLQQGTHAELLANENGKYKELYEMQFAHALSA